MSSVVPAVVAGGGSVAIPRYKVLDNIGSPPKSFTNESGKQYGESNDTYSFLLTVPNDGWVIVTTNNSYSGSNYYNTFISIGVPSIDNPPVAFIGDLNAFNQVTVRSQSNPSAREGLLAAGLFSTARACYNGYANTANPGCINQSVFPARKNDNLYWCYFGSGAYSSANTGISMLYYD